MSNSICCRFLWTTSDTIASRRKCFPTQYFFLSCVCIGKQHRISVYPSPCLPASCLSTAIKSYSLPCQTSDGFLVIRLPFISPSSFFLIHAGLVFGFFYHAESWRALKEMGWAAETGVGEVNHTSKKSLSSWLISSRGKADKDLTD